MQRASQYRRPPPIRGISTVVKVVGTIASGYAGVLALLWLSQKQIIFPGAGVLTPYKPTRTGGTLLRTQQGAVGLTFPAGAGQPTVVFLHGNGDQLAWSPAELGASMHARGIGFVGVEYPGFGPAGGSPSESTINEAARLLVAEVMARDEIPPDKLVIFGQSIGCAPALVLCEQYPEARVVLVSPFVSVQRMAVDAYPFLRPASWLLRWMIADKFDNDAQARRVANRALVVHGTQDEIVPFVHGQHVHRALWNALPLHAVDGAHHNDILAYPAATDSIFQFISDP
eukprot:TRINITY_DN29260_c0_g2_i1.p1 TRINITY_DN29260_c0_g2~~TRINITY_DN29260_c0_g2_i1.p1  ORF type:complete len:285 (-),score=42.82 TRINITY_DN29260_c0_g2_i1:268-1122(-)